MKFWESIQTLCSFLNELLKQIESQQSEVLDFQNVLITLARVESLRKLLNKEEIVNLELAGLDDVLEIGKELEFNLYQLGSLLDVGTSQSALAILTDQDRKEWENYQVERNAVSRKLDYCFAISSIPTLKCYIFKESLNDCEVEKALKLIRGSKNPGNPIVKAFTRIQDDLDAARLEFNRIREITDRDLLEVRVEITQNKIMIGAGSHGNVYKTTVDGENVVIKQIKAEVSG